MKEIFLCVLSLSASGALTGLLLLMIRPFTLKFLSKKWNYYIWILVVAYLILPIRFKVIDLPTLSIGGTMIHSISDAGMQEIQEIPESTEFHMVSDISDIHAVETGENTEMQGLESWENTGNWKESGKSDYESQMPGKTADWMKIAAGLWILGTIVTLIIKIRNYGKFSKQLRKMSQPITDELVSRMAESLSDKLSMKKKPGIYESPVVSGPITLGLCHPMIILPKEEQDLLELELVLHHEMMHIKRKDLWYKWIYQILLCVHWFNPVLYLVEKKINIDCELSCDEAVLEKLTEDGKKAYGNILLNAAEKNVDFRKSIFSTTLLERKEDLKERLKGILQYKKQNAFKVLLSLVVLTGVLLFSACGAQFTSDGVPFTSEKSLAEVVNDEEFGEQYGVKLNFFERLFWNTDLDYWLNTMNVTDKAGDGWDLYDDNTKLAGDDFCDHWQAYYYSGGDKLDCAGFLITGSDSILIVHATEKTEIQISAYYELLRGKFKLVLISPDGTVTTIEDEGEGKKKDIILEEGRNVIKMVGQGAKLKNLKVRYYGLDAGTIENIYYSEEQDYAERAFDTGETVNKDKIMNALPYMENETASKAFAALLTQGESFSTDELVDIFIYSDSDLSSHYLVKAISDEQTEPLSAEAISEIIPYLSWEGRSEIISTIIEEVTFDDLEEWAPYLSSEQLERCLISYMEAGNTLTYSQFYEVSPYLNTQSIDKLDTLMQKE